MSTLAEKYQTLFPPRFRIRGELYQRQGRVLQLDQTGEAWVALVRGSGAIYEVYLDDLDDEDPYLDCDCPAAGDRGVCKHMWATMRAIDARQQGAAVASPDWRELAQSLAESAGDDDAGPLLIHYRIGMADSPSDSLYQVDVLSARPIAAGGIAKFSRLQSSARGSSMAPADRRLMTMLQGAQSMSGFDEWATPAGRYWLDGTRLEMLWRDLIASGNAYFEGDPPEAAPLRLDTEPPFSLQVRFDRDGPHHVAAEFVRGERREAADDLNRLAPDSHFMLEDRLVARYEPEGAHPLIKALKSPHFASLPPDEIDEFFVVMQRSPWAGCFLPPTGWTVAPMAETPPIPRLDVKVEDRGSILEGRLDFDYGGHTTEGVAGPYILDADTRYLLPRDLEVELAIRNEIVGWPSIRSMPGSQRFLIEHRELSNIVADFHARGWIVEANGLVQRHSTGLKAVVESGQDWFDLRGGLEYGAQILPFPRLLEALRQGRDRVRLDDGSEGVLPREWLRRQGVLELASKEEGEGLRFAKCQGLLLDLLLEDVDDVDLDASFRRWRRELRNFQGIKPVKEPRGFQGTLREYQRDGLGWMRFLRQFGFGGCLADDMGLGKTVQVLADLKSLSRRRAGRAPTLVVAPRSVVHNWINEAARFTPSLEVLDYSGPDRKNQFDSLAAADLVVTTYGVLRRDIVQLRDVAFRGVVLDEAQAIKNQNSQTAKACRLLRADERLALSGTPIENRIEELWSIFEFLNPGMFGGVETFRRLSGPDEESRAELARALAPFILRRTKEEVATDLPDKTEQILECDLGPKQRRLYDELRSHYRNSLNSRIAELGLEKSQVHVLEALLRLRQAACHPALIDPKRKKESAAKLDLLMERLAEVVAEGHKALVFSQFTQHLGLIRARLEARGIDFEYLDGGARNRAKPIDRFQTDPACGVFLISLKAGGTGLNLTAADYVFIMDPWWNPASEAQAIDRSHRIGQTRQVFVYRLIARDTIEEKILAMQDEKRELARSILDGGGPKTLRDLTADDLHFLLS